MFSSVPLNASACTPLLVRSWLVSEKSCESSPLLALTRPDVPARCSTASPHAVTSPAVIAIGRMARRRRPGLRGADIVGSVAACTADAVRSSSSHAEGSGRRSIRHSFGELVPEYDRPVLAGLYQTPSEPLGTLLRQDRCTVRGASRGCLIQPPGRYSNAITRGDLRSHVVARPSAAESRGTSSDFRPQRAVAVRTCRAAGSALRRRSGSVPLGRLAEPPWGHLPRSEEHTSELQPHC